MIISAKEIKHSRKYRLCAMCKTELPIYSTCYRLFGYGVEGDKPYAIYVCLRCAQRACE
jgi:hypothetical protein